MYDLSTVLSDLTVGPGTNVLVSGPPLSGKQNLAYDVIANGGEHGEGIVVITTKDDAATVRENLHTRFDSAEDHVVGIIDCVSRQQGSPITQDDNHVKYVSSPSDMTSIGIKLSELLEQFQTEYGFEQNRILLDSTSTLLMYTDLETVFRFLHVLTGRVTSSDALGIYTIDSTAQNDQTMNTLKQLFDGVIEVEENDDDSTRRIHTAGLEA